MTPFNEQAARDYLHYIESRPDRMPARERVAKDATFAALVDLIYAALVNSDFTPTEVRDAAMYAAIKFEMERPRSYFLPPGSPVPDHLKKKENFNV